MAINRVTQDMKHLDPCLASPFGRAILQHLPPDALATLLGSDALALLSENTTLAAIDRPWLCLGLQGCHELPLMQQYYSSDSHGRYELAMQLLRSGRGCPWSVMLRRGLPATFSKAASTIYSAEHEVGSSRLQQAAGSSKLGSGIGSGSGSVTNGVSDDGFGTYTGLSRMRSLLEGAAAGGRSSSGSAEDLQTLQQQGAAAAAAAAAAEGGILLEQKVLGGYVWRLSLVAVPWQDTCKASSSSSALPAAAAAAAAAGPSGAAAQDGRDRRLCLSVPAEQQQQQQQQGGAP
ncbi:hypothetical protein OEZ86_002566 [Tetradesmus obliquus]|nr:hypothetical protein OEZ86_002535 [Tetradesmus obliquus]WIA31674.1 hypothetical protein OEZ86_002554 [Tetradesmus obliquus]WIA31687.1 hypothetical protein OEZ86_002566 [Tetradesmus obliquus]